MKRGFTLLEILLAMMVLAGGISLMATSWVGNFRRLEKSEVITEVAWLLENKIAEIEAEYRKDPSQPIDDDEGDFGKDFPEYTWTVETQELEFPDISALLTAQEGGATGIQIQLVDLVTEYLSSAVTEVKVTVTAQRRRRPMSYSVTTFFVDHSKRPPLPGGASLPGGGPQAPSGGPGS